MGICGCACKNISANVCQKANPIKMINHLNERTIYYEKDNSKNRGYGNGHFNIDV